MSGATARVTPRYVRLSGEIADQAILDSLRAIYPDAVIAHAFASTEAGVAFDVTDGRAGFPAALVGAAGRIDLKVEDGTLRIRSSRTAARYLGPDAPALAGDEGFVDTGDLVEFRDGRYYFLGRRGGIINVGGLKVHPEEVEAVINADPRVRLSRVQARRSPITGAIVVAEVVLHGDLPMGDAADDLKSALLERCRAELKPHKVPASLRFVPTIEMTAAGKLVRPSG
jgi:acyl-coenzyme A synthetase/AMP-(fatty) acid ligase